MKKYLLLLIPFFFYGRQLLVYWGDLFFCLQVFASISVLTGFMVLLLKRTTLSTMLDWTIATCFSIYFCFLFHITVEVVAFPDLHSSDWSNLSFIVQTVNVHPIRGILDIVRNNPNATFQIVGNLLMLSPFAFVMRYFSWVNSTKRTIMYGFFLSFVIEVIQLVETAVDMVWQLGIRRSPDSSDVLLNTAGAMFGALAYHVWKTVKQPSFGKNGRLNPTIQDQQEDY
ncbi:VanZ family protein [Priestia koreensis]|uniref:VanZ-like domain-containing protein n=1 Tax=Priestia koreensis TaxID=284581 RepID=A0A0M0L513_9BACI|nr:VanZ family protein [Priestia koreensis]KOO46161.1 hypothetical protein AMD01_09855 [Priestia koreensis]